MRKLDTFHLVVASVLVGAVSLPVSALADAVIPTNAMKASTIIEIFIEDDHIRVELEIGNRDMNAFRGLLPGSERRGLDPTLEGPTPLQRFFREEWVMRTDRGEPMEGKLAGYAVRRRIMRDEITGEKLPIRNPGAEDVMFMDFLYPLPEQPRTLTIRPPMRSTGSAAVEIGFVAYHRGLAINDFQYLTQEETLIFDWADPWFTAFRNPDLLRHYAAPVSAFLYVEPFEVRKEIVMRPRDLQEWADLGIADADTIPIEIQEELKRRVVEYLMPRGAVRIDGRLIEPILDRVHFIRRELDATTVIEPPEELDSVSAMLGIIFAYPTEGYPREVTMDWDLFGPRARNVFASVTDDENSVPTVLTPDESALRWVNNLKNPKGLTMRTIAPPPLPPLWRIPLVSAGIALVALALLLFATAKRSTAALVVGVLLTVSAFGLRGFAVTEARSPLAKVETIDDTQAQRVLEDLLYNIYRSFDRRDESLVYDRLAQSVAGEMLTDVYLQTRRGMELENQGGAQVKVNEVTVLDSTIESVTKTGGFDARCRWTAAGSVGHWGHAHQRVNQYDAVFTVEPLDGVWKIAAVEVREEIRLDPDTQAVASSSTP